MIEHGITVAGKSLADHLEAVDHYAALQCAREVVVQVTPITEKTIREPWTSIWRPSGTWHEL